MTIMGIVLSSQHLLILIGSVLVMSATKVSSCNSIDLDLVLPTKLLVLLLSPCRFWRSGNDTN